MKKMTLLQKAKSIKKKSESKRYIYSDENLELVMAWLKGEIGPNQMMKALLTPGSVKTGNYLYYCASILRQAYNMGKIRIMKNNRAL